MHPTFRTSSSRTGIARLLSGAFTSASPSSSSSKHVFVKTQEVVRYTAIRDFFKQQQLSSATRCSERGTSMPWSTGVGVGVLRGVGQVQPFGLKAGMMSSRFGATKSVSPFLGSGMRAFITSSVRRAKEDDSERSSKPENRPAEATTPKELEPKPPESATSSSPGQKAEECICKRSNNNSLNNANNNINTTTPNAATLSAYPYVDPTPAPPSSTYSPLPPSSHSPFYPDTNIDKQFPHSRDHENYSEFFKRLAQSLPHPHRPTRDDFLKVATGFWQRVRIRFKWFTIKSFRKFNADDISAFVTWFLMSQMFWVLLGTTTFFSVFFAIANSLRLQHYLARAISDYLTSETGITIIFESAVVPKWKASALSFKNVYVSCRPKDPNARNLHTHPPAPKRHTAHTAAIGYDVSNHPATHRVEDEDEYDEDGKRTGGYEDEDTNYTMFDLNIDSVDVTLSFKRWLDGKGLVESAVVRGVRGVVDRRNVFWDPLNPLDPATFRHPARPGDFELTSLQLEDVLVTVYQPGDFRPYTASIFRADMRMFRKRWAFYDFLCAENVVGQFDNCLFSLHKPQSIGRTNEMDLRDGDWVRMSRIRIDGVNIDHLQNSTTMEGPISWITSGKVDAVLDIKFPRDPNDDLPFNAILEEIAEAITTSLANVENLKKRIPGQRELAKPPLQVPQDMQVGVGSDAEDGEGADLEGEGRKEGAVKPKVVIDIDLRFRDLKAAVPIFTSDLSYVNNALIRPIVAFMNANRTLIPIRCRVVKDLDEFDGSWTMWETGLMDEISLKVYEALAYHVSQSAINRQRMKTVSLWSLHMTASAVMSALRTAVDPMGKQLREIYLTSRATMRARAEEAARLAAAVEAEGYEGEGEEDDGGVREVVGFYGVMPLVPQV